MCQYRNSFYSNADHTRRIRKGRGVTKSDECAQKRTGRMPRATSLIVPQLERSNASLLIHSWFPLRQCRRRKRCL